MSRGNCHIDLEPLLKKSFVKYFLSWDCGSQLAGPKTGFKIIEVKNINE